LSAPTQTSSRAPGSPSILTRLWPFSGGTGWGTSTAAGGDISTQSTCAPCRPHPSSADRRYRCWHRSRSRSPRRRFVTRWSWVSGTILASGRRTVAAALRAVGLGEERRFTTYHRVLNRGVWSALVLSRLLLDVLVRTFLAPDAPLEPVVDGTLERRRGRKVAWKGRFHDATRSQSGHVVTSDGIHWVCVMLLAPVPWSRRRWALPFLAIPTFTPAISAKLGKAHRTAPERAEVLVRLIRRWQPHRTIQLVGTAASRSCGSPMSAGRRASGWSPFWCSTPSCTIRRRSARRARRGSSRRKDRANPSCATVSPSDENSGPPGPTGIRQPRPATHGWPILQPTSSVSWWTPPATLPERAKVESAEHTEKARTKGPNLLWPGDCRSPLTTASARPSCNRPVCSGRCRSPSGRRRATSGG